MQNYGEYVGISNLHVAEVTEDTAAAYTADTPEYLAPASSVNHEPNVSTKNRYYDNKPYYTTVTEGETKVTLVISGIDIKVAAKLLGRHYDETAKRLYDTGDAKSAPYFALGFKADVEGGAKYYWYLKGKFSPFKEEASTVSSDIDEKTTSLEYTAIVTEHSKFSVNGVASALKRVVGDTRLDTQITDTTWFAAVQKPADVVA